MARFLLNPESGLPERMLVIMNGLGKRRKTFRPFSDPEFTRLFEAAIAQRKNRISTFYARYALLKKNLKVNLKRNEQPGWWSAEADDHYITMYKRFFNKPQYEKSMFFEHELTHVIQGLLERKKPGRRGSLYEQDPDSAEPTRSYYNDHYEIEPWTKDFYRLIMRQRNRGNLKTKTHVVAWLKRNRDFKKFYKHNQQRIMRKILANIFDR